MASEWRRTCTWLTTTLPPEPGRVKSELTTPKVSGIRPRSSSCRLGRWLRWRSPIGPAGAAPRPGAALAPPALYQDHASFSYSLEDTIYSSVGRGGRAREHSTQTTL
eukprot:scaffold224298_cov30-Tisochrysis_lutea.AAC.3